MEFWDVYDENRRLTGRTHKRGEPMKEGENHLVVGAIVFNSKNEILVTKRSDCKEKGPGMWESTGGAVIAGEDSRTGMQRELFEETGISAELNELVLLKEQHHGHAFLDIYIVKKDVAIHEIILQETETQAAKWLPFDCWRQKLLENELMVVLGTDFESFAGTVEAYIKQYNNKETGTV